MYTSKHRILTTLLCCIALLLVPLDEHATVADTPNRNPFFVEPSSLVTNRNVCIQSGDSKTGERFCLADLALFTPKWKIPPPVWSEYPVALDSVPLVTRTYSPDTISYLAQHEIHHGVQDRPNVALTIDCEYGPDTAQHMLDTLSRGEVQVTFFLQGRFVYRNPELVRRMLADGHELGSHSFFHPLFTELPPLRMTQEVTYTEAAVAWAIGKYVPMRYFRFPYARRNKATREHVAALGYQSTSWNVDPRGWDPNTSPKDIVDHIRLRAQAGSIVILHCSSWDDALALPDAIRALRERGLTPGTVSDVLQPQDRDVPGYQILPPA